MTEDEAWEVFAAMHDEEKIPRERWAVEHTELPPGTRLTEEQAFIRLMQRLGHARNKHPGFAVGAYAGFAVIVDEVLELRYAVGHESRERQIDEALDVAATAMRFVMGEHLNGK